MQPLTHSFHGQLLRRESRLGLLLEVTSQSAAETTPDLVHLRYALVVQGSERHVFPGLLLDDWGRERNTLSLYRWIFEEGQRFPRAELFGWQANGEQTQIFLRDLEIFFKYPCYAFAEAKAPVQEGERLHMVFMPDAGHEGEPEEIRTPQRITWPLQRASVLWQRANPQTMAQHGWRPA